MKRLLSICFIGGGERGDELLREMFDHVKHDIYKPLAKEYEYSGHGQISLPLEENSESYKYVMEMVEKYRLHPTIFQIVHYTKAEEEKAEFFQMNILSPLELEGTSASDYGTQYAGGCPDCGLGGKPVSDVFVNRKFMKRYNIGTLLPDIYVSESVKELICSNELTGVSFDFEVKDYQEREMAKFYVMNFRNVLPPMSKTAWLINDLPDSRYEKCGHQVVYLRSDVQYEREKLSGALDLNLTSEYVDNYRLQEIIVSAKARKLFKQNKVYAGFFPVEII